LCHKIDFDILIKKKWLFLRDYSGPALLYLKPGFLRFSDMTPVFMQPEKILYIFDFRIFFLNNNAEHVSLHTYRVLEGSLIGMIPERTDERSSHAVETFFLTGDLMN